MRNDVYDYPLAGQVSQNIVLQKLTACWVYLSFLLLPAHLPAAL